MVRGFTAFSIKPMMHRINDEVIVYFWVILANTVLYYSIQIPCKLIISGLKKLIRNHSVEFGTITNLIHYQYK